MKRDRFGNQYDRNGNKTHNMGVPINPEQQQPASPSVYNFGGATIHINSNFGGAGIRFNDIRPNPNRNVEPNGSVEQKEMPIPRIGANVMSCCLTDSGIRSTNTVCGQVTQVNGNGTVDIMFSDEMEQDNIPVDWVKKYIDPKLLVTGNIVSSYWRMKEENEEFENDLENEHRSSAPEWGSITGVNRNGTVSIMFSDKIPQTVPASWIVRYIDAKELVKGAEVTSYWRETAGRSGKTSSGEIVVITKTAPCVSRLATESHRTTSPPTGLQAA